MIDIINGIKKYESLSIIGNYKNVGKTTTLNFIIKEAKGITLGLTSIGVDGESEDVVSKTKKPRIYIKKGTIIATSKSCVLESDITKEILEVTNINTPLGKIVIFKALSDGYIKLSGPSINSQIKYVLNRLKYFGCELSIVDGALSRKTLASPSITQATIFCSGASLSLNIDKVVEDTIHEVNMIDIESIDDDNFYNIYEKIEEYKVSIINGDYSYKNLNLKTTLNSHEEIINNLDENSKYIYLNGIITTSFIQNLIKSSDKYKDKIILIEDGTKVFIDKLTYQKFIHLGGCIKAINKINLIGISLNPTSPSGYSFDSDEFLDKISKNTNIKIFDVCNIGGVK